MTKPAEPVANMKSGDSPPTTPEEIKAWYQTNPQPIRDPEAAPAEARLSAASPSIQSSPEPENVGVVVHGSLVPEESAAARLAIAAANCIGLLEKHSRLDESYRKGARQVEAELRAFAKSHPPAPTLSEVIDYRKEMERIVELRAAPPPSSSPPASEITEAINGFESFAKNEGVEHFESYEDWQSAYLAARSRLEGLFREQREEIERPREDLLTAEEAKRLVGIIDVTPLRYPPELTVLYKKLRRLSQSRVTKDLISGRSTESGVPK